MYVCAMQPGCDILKMKYLIFFPCHVATDLEEPGCVIFITSFADG